MKLNPNTTHFSHHLKCIGFRENPYQVTVAVENKYMPITRSTSRGCPDVRRFERLRHCSLGKIIIKSKENPKFKYMPFTANFKAATTRRPYYTSTYYRKCIQKITLGNTVC